MTARTPSRIGLTRWLIGHTRRLVPVLGVAVVARIAGQLMGVALLVLAADAIARTSSGTAVSLPGLVGLLAAVALGKALLRYLEHYAGHWVAFTALQRLRELFFDRLIPQAPAATTGRAGAELTERATRDIDRIEVFFAHTLPPAVAAVAVPGVALAWLASV
nr:ABC transporter ATP-binding protein [Micropruina sp.]